MTFSDLGVPKEVDGPASRAKKRSSALAAVPKTVGVTALFSNGNGLWEPKRASNYVLHTQDLTSYPWCTIPMYGG